MAESGRIFWIFMERDSLTSFKNSRWRKAQGLWKTSRRKCHLYWICSCLAWCRRTHLLRCQEWYLFPEVGLICRCGWGKWKKIYTKIGLLLTLMYSPRQRLERANLLSTFLAFTPLSMKKYSRRSVVSTKILGMISLIELILLIQFLQISCADSGMLAPFSSEIVIYFIL